MNVFRWESPAFIHNHHPQHKIIDVKLLFSPNPKGDEICLYDSPDGLRKLGQSILKLDKEIELSADRKVCDDDIYPCRLKKLGLKINNDRQNDDLLHISVAENNLVIEGTSIALGNLGEILSEFDDNTPNKYHIHLDYFPGVSGLLAPTNLSLVIACEK